jgi:hypothetical protein
MNRFHGTADELFFVESREVETGLHRDNVPRAPGVANPGRTHLFACRGPPFRLQDAGET